MRHTILLGFPPNSLPTSSQVKAAYKKKALETHPDRFPPHQKALAESKFKLISEAYASLHSGGSRTGVSTVVKTGVPRAGGRRNLRVATLPFAFIILGALTLGWIHCFQGLSKTEGGSSFFQSFSPLISIVYIHEFQTLVLF